MFTKDAGYAKKMRLARIAKVIAQGFNEGGTDYERLLIWIQFEEGLTRERAVEYVDLVLKRKDWYIHNGKIVAEIPES